MFTAIYHVEIHGNIESKDIDAHGEQVIFIKTSLGFSMESLTEHTKNAGRIACESFMREIISDGMLIGHLDVIPSYDFRNTLADKQGSFDLRVNVSIERERYVESEMTDMISETERPLIMP